jgi:hypothetical protein
MDTESRVVKLEEAMGDIRVQLAAIAEKLAVLPKLEAKLDIMSSQVGGVRVELASQLGDMRLDMANQLRPVRSDLDNLRGEVARMPSTWAMVVAIIGGQVALAGLIAAVVFGVAHLLGRV